MTRARDDRKRNARLAFQLAKNPALRPPAPLPSPHEQAIIDRFGIFDEDAR